MRSLEDETPTAPMSAAVDSQVSTEIASSAGAGRLGWRWWIGLVCFLLAVLITLLADSVWGARASAGERGGPGVVSLFRGLLAYFGT